MNQDETRVQHPAAAAMATGTVARPTPGADATIAPGTLLVNTYRVERLLGSGGMGEVYLARHAGLGTQHAIKVIRPDMAANSQVMDLFYREAKVLRGVRHEAIVSYDGFVRDADGRDYLVMEYVDGPSLAQRMRAGPLPASEVLMLRDRLADGLAEAHRRGAIHRDISPDNIILPGNRVGAAELIDFGLSKLTDPTQATIIGASFAGKLRFAAPEQFGMFGGEVDGRSDNYSLGLTLAAAALGRPLDMGNSFEAAIRARQTVPDLTGIDASLRPWLAAMLEPDPARRPASLKELLARWPANPGPLATVVLDRTRAGEHRGPPRALRWVIGLVLLTGAGGSLYWFLPPPPRPTPPSTTATDGVVPSDQPSASGPPTTETLAKEATDKTPEHPPDDAAQQPQRSPAAAPEAGPKQEERPPVASDRPVPGARFAEPLSSGGLGPTMVWLPAGEFKMGSPPGESGRNPDEQSHLARVPEPIALGETEVTLAQFRQFVQKRGYRTEVDRISTCLKPDESREQLVPDISLSWESPGYPVSDNHPVACVSWNDARAYLEWLTAQTGHQYRLPTELEWEYAARAGTTSSRYWGDNPKAGCKLANTAECKDGQIYTAPTATFPPNPFGLRDLLGNLAEWTCSGYGTSYNGDESRCSDTAGSGAKVFRGGSWLDAPGLVRAAARDGAPANLGLNTVGFRPARVLSP